jgi:hypothetical protein
VGRLKHGGNTETAISHARGWTPGIVKAAPSAARK